MTRRNNLVKMLTLWASVLATIAIGFALVGGTLAVPLVGVLINQIAGWVIVVGGVLSVLQLFGLMK